MPGGGGTQLLARLVGPARAKQIAITGRQDEQVTVFHHHQA